MAGRAGTGGAVFRRGSESQVAVCCMPPHFRHLTLLTAEVFPYVHEARISFWWQVSLCLAVHASLIPLKG